jgi:hypothetical protein
MNSSIAAENLGLLNDNKQLSSLIKEYEQTLETLMSAYSNTVYHKGTSLTNEWNK